MYLGPIHSTLPGRTVGHQPVKQIVVKTTGGKAVNLFASTVPYVQQRDVIESQFTTAYYEATQAAVLQRIHQLEELASNTEWQRCGLFVQFREDGVQDGEDGWYFIAEADIGEDLIFSAYAEPAISLQLRNRQNGWIGSLVDAKTVTNDANLGGITMAAQPAGIDANNDFPPSTYTLVGRNGNILIAENPVNVLRAPVTSYVNMMSQGRCFVYDETVNGSTSVEVFSGEHLFINGYCRITNDLLRYTLHLTDTAPLVEVWSAGAWVTLGSYQLQAYSGSAYTALPLQSFALDKISPEEIMWTEVRYDGAGTGLVRVQNRIRRGSRLVESAIVAASGQGLTGPQSVGLTGTGATAIVSATDGTGVVGSGVTPVAGFAYISTPPVAATLVTGTIYSGLSVPAGTVGRISVLAGLQDAQFTSLATFGAYAQRWVNYNRVRVRQLLLVS